MGIELCSSENSDGDWRHENLLSNYTNDNNNSIKNLHYATLIDVVTAVQFIYTVDVHRYTAPLLCILGIMFNLFHIRLVDLFTGFFLNYHNIKIFLQRFISARFARSGAERDRRVHQSGRHWHYEL